MAARKTESKAKGPAVERESQGPDRPSERKTRGRGKPGPTRKGSGYGADAIQMLEGLEAVRKRPGMYIGGTGEDGLAHLLWELIDNAVDEAAAGHAGHIGVVFHADGSYEVVDDGRGIPVDRHAKKKVSALEVVFSELHAGGKFGSGAYTASGGLHGVGASVVNALSRKLVAEVERDGVRWRLTFVDRQAGRFDERPLRAHPRARAGGQGAGEPHRHPRALLARHRPVRPRGPHRGRPRARPHRADVLPGARSRGHARSTGAERRAAPSEPETFRSARGLPDYVEQLSVGEPLIDPVLLSGEGSFEETVPVDGRMQRVSRTCRVQAAFRWVKGYDIDAGVVREHDPHPRGRHPPRRLRAGLHLRRQRRAGARATPRSSSASRTRPAPPATTSRRAWWRCCRSRCPSRSSGARPSGSWARPPCSGSSTTSSRPG